MQNKKLLAIFAASILTINYANASILFSEDFNSLADETTITNRNTGFSYVAAGSSNSESTVSLAQAVNPSTIDSGSSLRLAADPGSTTAERTTYVGHNSINAGTIQTFAITLNITSLNGGSIAFGMGGGNTVRVGTNANQNLAHYLWRIVVDSSGNLQYTTGGSNINAGYTLSLNTVYDIVVQVNATDDIFSQDGITIASHTLDLYVNGELVGNDLALQNGSQSESTATAFRIAAIASTAANGGQIDAQFDDIKIWDTIVAVPEVASLGMFAIGGIPLLIRRRHI